MIEVIKYQVRSGGVQPKGSGCPTGVPNEYIYQTFGATKTITDVYDAKTELLRSSDMQGLKPGDVNDASYRNSTFTRATYNGSPMRTTDGEPVFTAQEDHVSEFVDEDEVPGWGE
jgi:hypothetical protein